MENQIGEKGIENSLMKMVSNFFILKKKKHKGWNCHSHDYNFRDLMLLSYLPKPAPMKSLSLKFVVSSNFKTNLYIGFVG